MLVSVGGDRFLGDGLRAAAAFLAFRAARLAFEAAVNSRMNFSFCLRLCSAAFLAYKDRRLAFESAVNTFANSRRDIFVFGLLGRGMCTYCSHIFFTRPSKEYSCFHPIDLIFEQSPNKVSTSHGL